MELKFERTILTQARLKGT